MSFFDDITTDDSVKTYEPIPDGTYDVVLTKVENEGNTLTVETTIASGGWEGRKAWKNFNFDESNQYLGIQKGILKKDMEAIGETMEGRSLGDAVRKLKELRDSEQLIEAYMKSKEASNGKVYTNCYFNALSSQVAVPKSMEFDKDEKIPSVFD